MRYIAAIMKRYAENMKQHGLKEMKQVMQRKNSRTAAVVMCVAILALIALAGCSASTNQAGVAPAVATAIQTSVVSDDATYVQVKSLDASAITGIVGSITESVDPSSGDHSQQGAPPDQTTEASGAAQGTTPGMASGENTQPSKQGTTMSFVSDDAVITFHVDSATLVTKLSGTDILQATLEDVGIGDILAVTLSSDNIAEAIVIQSVFDTTLG